MKAELITPNGQFELELGENPTKREVVDGAEKIVGPPGVGMMWSILVDGVEVEKTEELMSNAELDHGVTISEIDVGKCKGKKKKRMGEECGCGRRMDDGHTCAEGDPVGISIPNVLRRKERKPLRFITWFYDGRTREEKTIEMKRPAQWSYSGIFKYLSEHDLVPKSKSGIRKPVKIWITYQVDKKCQIKDLFPPKGISEKSDTLIKGDTLKHIKDGSAVFDVRPMEYVMVEIVGVENSDYYAPQPSYKTEKDNPNKKTIFLDPDLARYGLLRTDVSATLPKLKEGKSWELKLVGASENLPVSGDISTNVYNSMTSVYPETGLKAFAIDKTLPSLPPRNVESSIPDFMPYSEMSKPKLTESNKIDWRTMLIEKAGGFGASIERNDDGYSGPFASKVDEEEFGRAWGYTTKSPY